MSLFDNNLVIPKTLRDYCETRERVLSLWRQGVKLINKAESEMQTVYSYGLNCDAKPRDDFESFRRDIDRKLWRTAFDKTGLMQLMDAQARTDFERDLHINPPEFTEDNIRSTFLTQMQSADDMFARGLVNVFLRLSDNYKTNSNEPFKVGKKAIMTYMIGASFRGGLEIGRGFYSRASDRLNDIDRVFKVLDGQQHHARSLETAMNAAFKEYEIYEDGYYRAKAFKNGNLHIQFKREDLLEKANKIISDYYNGQALAKDKAA